MASLNAKLQQTTRLGKQLPWLGRLSLVVDLVLSSPTLPFQKRPKTTRTFKKILESHKKLYTSVYNLEKVPTKPNGKPNPSGTPITSSKPLSKFRKPFRNPAQALKPKPKAQSPNPQPYNPEAPTPQGLGV